MNEIIEINSKESCKKFVEKVIGKRPLFICTLGNTATAKILGISAAGASPEITDLTPAADAEYLYYEHCKCIDGVPVTPNGIPTPALITRVALELGNIPFIIAVGGLQVLPQTPYIDFGGTPGEDITTGHAVKNAREPFERAMMFGKQLAKVADYLVIGESIAGGTTTALGVLTALGINAGDKISSSLPINPIDLKRDTVMKGLRSNNLHPGELKGHPFEAIEAVGDPMQPVHAGIAIGAAESIPVILAGGTQMSAVLAIIKELSPKVLRNIAIGTTKWIISDKTSDLPGIINQISPDVPIFAANLNFSKFSHPGLLAYEQNVVKEGVGAGGATIAMLWTNNKINLTKFYEKLEQNYLKLLGHKK